MLNIDIKTVIEQETGEVFKRGNKICCPLHREKSPSFYIFTQTNSYFCFGCQKGGDVIDFIREYKGFNYVESCKHLGIELDETRKKQESDLEIIKKNVSNFIAAYRFEDKDGKTLYYKVKYKNRYGKKATPYLQIINGEIVWNRENCIEVPYNLTSILRAISNKRDVYIVEGEKDADTLKKWGYVATSLKGITEFDLSIFENVNVYFVGDTGEGGEIYKNHVFEKLSKFVRSFNIIELTGIEELGDNKDITDWIEEGHTKEEFVRCIFDSWNWKDTRKWRYYRKEELKNGFKVYPLKHWRNLGLLLSREGIKLTYNELSREIEACGSINSTRNELLIDIQNLALIKGMKLSKEDTRDFIYKLAIINKKNDFKDYLIANRNNNYSIIDDVFECLEFAEEEQEFIVYYHMLFKKFYINAAKQAFNDFEKGYTTQGVLVLQGAQGKGKTTFFKKIMPNGKDFFLDGQELKPHDKDNVMRVTKYPIVELGELDGTLKKELASLKAFITSNADEYRAPYQAVNEKYPRVTSFVATVNRKDFLKDETGDRRYWVLPIIGIKLDKLLALDIKKFWGALYDLYMLNKYEEGLNKEELEFVTQSNVKFSCENDVSISIDDGFNFEMEEHLWRVYTISEIAIMLELKEKKSIKNALERLGYKHKVYKEGGRAKRGFKLPSNKSDKLNRF